MTGREAPTEEVNIDRLTVVSNLKLEDLVDRNLLQEVIRSFSALFGLAIRVFASDGQMLSDAGDFQPICKYVNQSAEGRAACSATIATVKRVDPLVDSQVVHPCFTGANYKIVSMSYDGRSVGKLILGPYLPVELKELPGSLLVTVPTLDPAKAKDLLPRMPRARTDTVEQIGNHMRAVLDLILFSGHKAYLTSQMHLASVRESYRELEDKNVRLQSAYEKLQELDRLKSNFIATVSHELRTPLTSIIGYSEMLAEGIAGELRNEQVEFVSTIREKGEQLLALIMSLLDLSKLESGTMSLQKADVDLSEILSDIVSSLMPSARKRSVSLVLDQPETVPLIKGDGNRLRQAILNLADNALKFTPDDGEVRLGLRVVTEESSDGDDGFGFALLSAAKTFVEVFVSDNGIGIPDDQRDRVFDAFYQVDSSSTREYGGTGLGLAIVKRLIEAHGGRVRVENNQPRGTVFIVALPVAS